MRSSAPCIIAMVTPTGMEDSIRETCSMVTVGVVPEAEAIPIIELISDAAVRLEATDADTAMIEVMA